MAELGYCGRQNTNGRKPPVFFLERSQQIRWQQTSNMYIKQGSGRGNTRWRTPHKLCLSDKVILKKQLDVVKCQNRVQEEMCMLTLSDCFHFLPGFSEDWILSCIMHPQGSDYPQIEFIAPLTVCICKYLNVKKHKCEANYFFVRLRGKTGACGWTLLSGWRYSVKWTDNADVCCSSFSVL